MLRRKKPHQKRGHFFFVLERNKPLNLQFETFHFLEDVMCTKIKEVR